jgi:hypothetical protein
MIKANELRVGNYFYLNTIDENCQPVKILTQANSMFIRDCEHYGEKWTGEPIPLSEDLLLRLGFVRINHSWSLNDGSENYHYEINGNERHFLLYFNGRQFSANDGKLSSFRYENNKHLHQLQNLYFALTGTELTLNP